MNQSFLDEEETISQIWGILSLKSKGAGTPDPFADDAAWIANKGNSHLVVAKADMLVSDTDAPVQMSPRQIASKAITSAVSDFAAKGVKPSFCLISIAVPKAKATRAYVSSLAEGFRAASKRYGSRIVGGDTNSSEKSLIIDIPIFGFANSIVKRSGARIGDLLGVSGKFGLTSAGLAILVRNAKSQDAGFRKRAVLKVLEPKARLDLGLSISKYISSCIDSSDGLAISLYHLAEASRVDIKLESIPMEVGVEKFARRNGYDSGELLFFGGEEYELVMTYKAKYRKILERKGIITIGKVSRRERRSKPKVYLGAKLIPRRGWIHNQ